MHLVYKSACWDSENKIATISIVNQNGASDREEMEKNVLFNKNKKSILFRSLEKNNKPNKLWSIQLMNLLIWFMKLSIKSIFRKHFDCTSLPFI